MTAMSLLRRCRLAWLPLAALAVAMMAGPAEANGRRPQVQLGDVPVEMVCIAFDGQTVEITNARIAGRREVEVQKGIATLRVPLGNIEAMGVQPLAEGATHADAFLTYASGTETRIALRVMLDDQKPIVIDGIVPGEGTVTVELRLCGQLRIRPAAGRQREPREPTLETAE
jgi:hypothetical protein